MKQHSKELIEATANAIKDHFIPKNADEKSFSFHFTIPPSSNYKVSYEKDAKGKWSFVAFEADEGKD
ncbi:hypothetical protein EZ428_06135 [Pedobacter frigiditerrae]|uniref:Uncharacterized protein n=1 Tax=Pedobacter frigiditerrae TaxID=2530452 RepID=A0A4V2MJI3_9SPHI|nr:hypothetical protein [Pedobacter frigiditerrae]TCC94346.1 hypothetical protein EZ428_06135 [Pedobacter frigiditerrae]